MLLTISVAPHSKNFALVSCIAKQTVRVIPQPSRTFADDQWIDIKTELLPKRVEAGRLVSRGLARRLQFDTYEPEFERYGGFDGVLLAERMFHADSMAVVEIERHLRNDSEKANRSRFAFAGLHMLLDDFGYDLETKQQFTRAMVDRIGSQLVSNDFRANLRIQLRQKFRRERVQLEALLNAACKVDDDDAWRGLKELRRRSRMIKPFVAELQLLELSARLTAPIGEIVPSILHMFVNRILLSSDQTQEMVLYSLLNQCYQSMVARASQRSNA